MKANKLKNFQIDVVASASLIGPFRLLPRCHWSFGKDWLSSHRMVARVRLSAGFSIVWCCTFSYLFWLSYFARFRCLHGDLKPLTWELSVVFKRSNSWTSVFYVARGRSSHFLLFTELVGTVIFSVWPTWLFRETNLQFSDPLTPRISF